MTLRNCVVVLALCGLVAAGCEPELRVPYIPTTLANWPQPYRGVSGLRVHVFTTGHVRIAEGRVLRGGSFTQHRDLPVPAFLIEHPTQGLILFNTGMDPKRSEKTPPPSGGWMSLMLQPELLPGKSLTEQMQAAGFKPDAVRWVVLSSMRFDHTGEVEHFPNARVVVAKAEHTYAQQGAGGYDTASFDDVAAWKFIDFAGAAPLATFLAHVDLLGDGSCLLLDVSGSTPGTMALLVRLREHPLLLADDVAVVSESVRYAAKPTAAYDLPRWWEHIWRLKRFKDLVPELIVIPGHDLGPADAARSKEFIVHAFSTPDREARATPTPGPLQRLIPVPM